MAAQDTTQTATATGSQDTRLENVQKAIAKLKAWYIVFGVDGENINRMKILEELSELSDIAWGY